MTWQKGDVVTLTFPAAIEEEPPSEWIFWPSGNCEPAVVTYRGPAAPGGQNISALTARPELTDYAVR